VENAIVMPIAFITTVNTDANVERATGVMEKLANVSFSIAIYYFNVKRTIWLKGYQYGNHIESSEQRLQEKSIAKNYFL